VEVPLAPVLVIQIQTPVLVPTLVLSTPLIQLM
jgi:hypothetical protein